MSGPSILELMDGISKKTELIAALPPGATRAELLPKAKLQKERAELLEQYERLIETQRRARAVKEHEERHPPLTKDCPICLETTPLVNASSFVWYACCGNGMCSSCADSARESGDLLTCPLCRSECPSNQKEGAAMMKERAKKGNPWAQAATGRRYRDGADDFPANEKEALKWLELAAAQNEPLAMHELYQLRYQEKYGADIAGRNLEKAMELLTKSADLGYFPAQANLAEISYTGRGGPLDMDKAAYYFTLAYSQDPQPMAAFYLGVLFLEGHDGGPADGGFDQSLYRAKYYLEQAAEKGVVHANAPLGAEKLALNNLAYSSL